MGSLDVIRVGHTDASDPFGIAPGLVVKLDRRTLKMLIAAEARVGARVRIFQGSYNAGRVKQSAGTHDRGGVLDCWPLTGDVEPAELVKALRQVGFAAWLRTPDQGPWGFHIHAVAIGHPDLSTGAARQVEAYRKGRNGLANNGKDDGPWRPRTVRSWPAIRRRAILADRWWVRRMRRTWNATPWAGK